MRTRSVVSRLSTPAVVGPFGRGGLHHLPLLGFTLLSKLHPTPTIGSACPGSPTLKTSRRSLRSKVAANPRRIQERNQRLEQYLDLVRPIAWHYAHRSPESAEDLQQVGLLGLLRASELYNEGQGTPFAAFARPHIRGAIRHYLRDLARPVRLPRRHQELDDRLRGVKRELEAQLGRLATETELRQVLGLSLEQWDRFRSAQMLSRPGSLSDVDGVQLEGASPWDATAHPPSPSPSEAIDEPIQARELLAALNRLNPVRQQVIRRVVLEGWSLRRTAVQLEISPMTVSRQLRRGLDELRSMLGGCGLTAQFAC